MSRLQEIESEITSINDQIAALNRQRTPLAIERTRLLSLDFIRANGVTADNIEPDRGDAMPWFGHVLEYGRWLKAKPDAKRFCVWNGTILFTAELIAERVDWSKLPGRVEDVPGWNEA